MANAAARARARALPPFDPFRIIFRTLTSVRVALILIGAAVVGALLGVVFPQAPDEVRTSQPAYAAYTEFQRGRYGVFTDAMRRLGLFEVFHSYWFNGLIMVLLLAVAVCTANRIPPIARNVRRPIRRVNDRYFERAHHRAEFATPAEPAAIVRELKQRRYRVEQTERDGATYLFADRFGWAQFGTFVSHLSLILFMSGAIVTKLVGFSTTISIAEGTTTPVFPTIHAGQMQVENLHAGETPDASGMPTRYFSSLAVFRGGKQICGGTSTVNGPLHCAGYVLHQTTFSPNGAALQVRDLKTGQVVYQEVEQLGAQGTAPNPHLTIRDESGAILFDDSVAFVPGDTNGTLIAGLPIRRSGSSRADVLFIGATQDLRKQWALHLLIRRGNATDAPPEDLRLLPGQTGDLAGLSVTAVSLGSAPLSVVRGIPGVEAAALLQLATTAQGSQYLDVTDMGNAAAAAPPATGQAAGDSAASAGRFQLEPGKPQAIGGFEYTFLGRRSITGITVRKDPGSTFIWAATALMMLGLGVTFYLPRRRLWAKITPERTYVAGVADRSVNFSGEMRRIGAAAGSPDAVAAGADED